MPKAPTPRTRTMAVIAQDPAVRTREGVLTARIEIPAEELAPGPRGARVHVIDYDATSGTLYAPAVVDPDGDAHEEARRYDRAVRGRF